MKKAFLLLAAVSLLFASRPFLARADWNDGQYFTIDINGGRTINIVMNNPDSEPYSSANTGYSWGSQEYGLVTVDFFNADDGSNITPQCIGGGSVGILLQWWNPVSYYDSTWGADATHNYQVVDPGGNCRLWGDWMGGNFNVASTSAYHGGAVYVATLPGNYSGSCTTLSGFIANCETASAQLTEVDFTPPAPSISLGFPVNSSTTIPDFTNWVASTSNALPGTLSIHYGLIGTGFPYADSITYSPFVNVNPLPILKGQPLFYPPLTIPAGWQAYAELDMASSTATSSVVDFYVDPNAPTPTSSLDEGLAAPFSTSFSAGTTPSAATCAITTSSFLDDPIGNLEEAGCNLFIPNTPQQADLYNSFNGIWSGLSSRVPFGYAGIIMAAFKGFQEGTDTSTLISTTTYAALSSVLDPLKTGISFLLILLLAFWIFRFIQHITL